MNRASFIKSLFVVAAAPKIISEIDLTTKSVVEHKQLVQCFEGIIPYVMNPANGFKCEYNPSNFKLSDLQNIVKSLDNQKRQQPFYLNSYL